MIPSYHRIHRRSDFQRVLSLGIHTRTRDLDLYTLVPAQCWPDRSRSEIALCGGPWMGMIVSKKVGNSVVRHRVARCIRAAFALTILAPEIPRYYVICARPSSAFRSSNELADQLRKKLVSE